MLTHDLHPRAYTPEEVRRFLPGLGRNGIYNAIRRGDIRSIRIGRRLYIPASEISRLLGRLPVDADWEP